MLGEIFYWVFNMSITAAVTGLIVLMIRTIRKIPRKVIYFLWIIPFLRMLFPFGLNSRYSIMSLISHFAAKTVTVFVPKDDMEFSMMNTVRAANSYFPIKYKVNILEQLFFVASVVWIVVFLAIIITLSVLYFTTIYEIKNSAHHMRENIYLSEKIQSPAIYGMFKPWIIIPLSYEEKDIEYVLAHENMHIRRMDNLWRIVAFFITSIHWFNPFAWLFLKLFLADTELACDECVVSKLDSKQKKEYALSLLECKDKPTILTSAFGGAKIRIRIENILSFKKMTWFSLIGFTILLTAIFYILLTNAG